MFNTNYNWSCRLHVILSKRKIKVFNLSRSLAFDYYWKRKLTFFFPCLLFNLWLHKGNKYRCRFVDIPKLLSVGFLSLLPVNWIRDCLTRDTWNPLPLPFMCRWIWLKRTCYGKDRRKSQFFHIFMWSFFLQNLLLTLKFKHRRK